jgi:hypothetical protein
MEMVVLYFYVISVRPEFWRLSHCRGSFVVFNGLTWYIGIPDVKAKGHIY